MTIEGTCELRNGLPEICRGSKPAQWCHTASHNDGPNTNTEVDIKIVKDVLEKVSHQYDDNNTAAIECNSNTNGHNMPIMQVK